jgi:F-type H+-transporting ATPase subunit b
MRRGWLIMGIALAALVLTVPAPSRGDEEHPSGEKKHALAPDKAHPSKAGEEAQQDIFGWAIDLGVWTLVVFLLLLFVLGKFAWKPMLQGLEHREKSIHAALKEAEQARDEAERLRQQLQAQIERANEQAREIMEEARKAAERSSAEMIAAARKEIQAERDRSTRDIEMTAEKARQQLWSETAQLATLVSGKVIRRQLGPEDHRQLVDEALAELRRASDDRMGRG